MQILHKLCIALTTLICVNPIAMAQDYPTRPISLIVPFAAGSTTDSSARLIAEEMARHLNQSIVVENKVGAGGTIAATQVSRSTADGYTLLWTTSSVQAIAPYVMPNLSWDPVKSFTPIGLALKNPQALLISSKIPASDFDEFVKYVKAHPNTVNYATLGPNTTQNLIMTLIMQELDVSMTQISYRSASQIYPDLIKGRVQVFLDNVPNAIPMSTREEVRLLAVTSKERLNLVPDAPSISEIAIPGFEAMSWIGLVAPVGVPRPVLDKLSEAFTHAIQTRRFEEWLLANGAIAADVETTPQGFSNFLEHELAKWKVAVNKNAGQDKH